MPQAIRSVHAARRAAGRAVLALVVFLCLDVVLAQQGPIGGANVNVISGTGADGDWTLQRQNEPTIACSSRNPRHCLAGANDYRTVDIPFPTIGERITGDAWQGWYTTKDGGQTWRSRLLPGYPQDTSAAGLASPLRGYPAGADPVVRAGTNGLFYYAGLVFDRDEDGGSAIFVARFIDNNNQEGSAGDPIDYLDASIVHRMGPAPAVVARRERERERERRGGRATAARRPDRNEGRGSSVRAGVERQQGIAQLVDKPWLAIDIPRTGAQTCTIGGGTTGVPLQSFPGGRVYIVYTLFDGPGEERGRIMFSSSADCGRTWSAGRVISRISSADVNDDGVANTLDVARVQASYNRTCGQTGYNANADVNNDCRVDLLDLTTVSRGVGQPVPLQPRLSQGATLAIDPVTGALQIVWRQFNDGTLPHAIVTVRSTNGGATISSPRVVAPVVPFDQGDSNTSFRTNGLPTIAMDGAGRAYIAWSARGYASQRPLPEEDDARVVLSSSANGLTWSAPQVVDPLGQPGHQIMPALTFAQGLLQLIYYDLREDLSQLFQRFVDELSILTGAPPRIRHTIDVRAAQAEPGPTPVFASTRLTQYQFGGAPGSQTVQQLEFNPPNLPLFRAGTTPFMGDYLDVTPETPFVRNGSTWAFNTATSTSPVFHGVWTDNRDIRPPANGVWTDYTPPNPPFPRPAMSQFDPTQPIPACVPGQAGMRNQNIYTARITRGLIVGALGNSRRLSTGVQRTFPVFAQNNSTSIRTYRLTINNQPVGGQASFRQFDLLTTLDVQVPRKSTVARTVFVRSSDPHAQITVSVVEIFAPAGTPVPNGQAGTIVLNPDPTNPDLENPDLENPDLENPDLENSEVHNPDLENAIVRNPDLENPDLENPDLENPDLENARVANPSILNPDLENPDLENPDLENPDLENPDLENTDLVNGALSDTTWTMTNKGNTAAAFTIKLGLNRQLPAGFRSQLLAHKIYQTPTVLGCSLLKQTQTVLLANIPNPRFVTASQFANPDLENPDLENLTVALAPGETARITLRVFDPIRSDAVTFRAADSVTPVAVAQAVSTAEVLQGVTQPTVAAVLTPSAPIPGSTVGGTYTTTLPATVPGTWTVAGGELPPGVTLNGTTGVITGTPTTPGTYTFTARFQSTTGLTDYRTMTVTVGGVGASADTAISATASVEPLSLGGHIVYSIVASNAGPAPAANVVVTDTLPEGTTFVSAVTGQGSCLHANGTVQCTLGTIPSGGSVSIQLRVRPRTAGTHTNHVAIAADLSDPSVTNNAANTTTGTGPVAPCTTVCFSGPTSFIAGPRDFSFGAMKGDFNEDGLIDLVYGPIGETAAGIMLGNGTGGFGAAAQISLPGPPQAGAVADFNNDGHLDIVTLSENVPQAWVLLGNGLGGFGAPIIVTVPNTMSGVAAADFNHDGNADIAVTGAGAGALFTILSGNGNATFQAPLSIGTSTATSDVVVEDFNNDGNLDLAVVGDDSFSYVLGSLTGFQGAITTSVPGASGIIQTGDLTGDGFPDLLVATGVPSAPFLVFASLGSDGGFAAPVSVGAPSNVEFPVTGDLDGDGDLDLVWTRDGGGIGIQLNNGAGGFAAPFYLSTPFAEQALTGDFNGDGRMDLALAVGGAFQSQVLVFLNTCDQPPADLAVTLTGPTGPVVEGNNFAYTIGVTNNGPNTATGVQLDFTFGLAADFVGISGSPGSCSVVRTRLTCQLGTLASGASSAFTVVVHPRSGVNMPSTAGVTATTSDPNPANNAAFLATVVTPGASTLVVTNTNESGPGSLFQALFDSNDPGPRDTISFNIPGSGPHTIALSALRTLPNINAPVVIDGTTQPGYAGTPLIELSGAPGNDDHGLALVAGNSIIRGLAINSFGANGIIVFVGSPGGNVFESNMIGTNPAGTIARPNGQSGIALGAPNNTIGGTALNAGNVISGNALTGIATIGSSTGNVLLRNLIGTDVTGTNALPNTGYGVYLESNGNSVGSVSTGVGNTIAFNNVNGVRVQAGVGNAIVNNSIFSNGALGIDLGPAGVTPNDAGDTDTGANNLLNHPVLSSARTVGTNALVQVALSPTPSGPFQVHFYANTACDASGSGEGQTPVGVASFGANPGGDTNFEASFPTSLVAPGTFLTATSTDSGGNTSEFSACAQVAADAGTANLSIAKIDTPDPVTVGSPLTYTIAVQNLGPNASSNATVTDVLPAGVTLVSANASAGSCTGTTTVTCSLGSIANGANVSIGIVVTPTAAGPLSNTATVSASGTDPDTANNSATTTTTVVPAATGADLSLTKSDSPDPVIVATALTYTLTVTNSGPATATGVTLTDVLPSGVTLVTATSASGSCTGTTTVSCTLNSIAPDTTATVTIVVTPTAIGSIVNTASVGAAETDPTPANNSATATTTVVGGPSTLVVINTNDSGAGSLRSAILAANATTGTIETIAFDIPGSGPHTISLATFLPTITNPVVIDGTTQPGYSGAPRVVLDGSNAGATANGLLIGSSGSGSTIRGLAINRFGTGGAQTDLGGAGIVIQGAGGNVIELNFIGTDADGLVALPNRADGIVIDNSPNNLIGGSGTVFNGNLISGNGRFGLMLNGAGTTGTRVHGNRIGLNAIGEPALGNSSVGIAIFDASQNTIGGPVGGPNLIAGNGGSAVRVASGSGNAILSNYLTANGGLGINLDPAGVNENDPGDTDTGPNNLQNFPVLTAVAGGVEIAFNGQPNTAFRVEVFGNTACDASGHGEAETFFGTVTITTDGTGNITPLLFPVAAGSYVTATATDPANNTSELSACALSGTTASLANVSPAFAQQGATLDVALTGQNTHFLSGTTTVGFGAGITINSFTVSSPTTATANVTIGATALLGGRAVTVTTGSEVVTGFFAVTPGPAVLTAVTPNSAQQGQANLTLAITGQATHFAQGVTTAFLGGDITVNSVNVTSPTTAQVNITLLPFAVPGARTITMVTDGEIASLTNGFTVIAGTPRVTSIVPASAAQGQTTNVAVTSQFTNFVNGTTTASIGPGITINSVTVTSATTASVNITVGVLANIGIRTVTLTTGAESASSFETGSFFNVTRGPAAIVQLTPSSGRQSESVSVTVTGSNTHFASGSTGFSFGSGITVTSAEFTGSTSATLNIAIGAGAALGPRTVVATTLGEIAEIQNGFTVTEGVAAISTVSPPTGRQAERLNVSVVGQLTHFAAGATGASFGSGITVNAVTVIDASHAVVDVTVTPGAALGARTVTLTTGGEIAQLVGGFTVTPGLPTLFSIAPVSALQGANVTVVLNGAFTNFTPQLTTASFGGGISVGTVTVNGPTLASVPISIAPGAAIGQRSVVVATGSEVVTLVNGFTVLQGTPAIASIDPNAGQRGLTRNVAITGVFTNWQAGLTSASYGAGVTVNSNVVTSATTLTTNVTIDSGAALGLRDVVITTGSEVLTVAGGFAITDIDTTPPAILRLSPAPSASGVPLNAAVTIEFGEPLARSTVTTSTLQLYDTLTGLFVAGSVTVDATGRVASFVPSQLLAVNRQYTTYLSNLITDVAGNHFGSSATSFFTGFSTDTTGPTLRLANPQNGDTGVARNVRIVLQFDRAINPATLGIGFRIQTGGATVPGTFAFEDEQRRLRFTPATTLAADASYVVTLTNQLRDVAGNALTNPGIISFATSAANDTVAPTAVAHTPYYNQTDVGRLPMIRIVFGERINPISVTPTSFYLYNYYTGAIIRSTTTVAADRLSITLVPDAPLEPHSYYYYVASPIADIAGNNGGLGTIFFRTSGVQDTVAPSITSLAPANGATGVPVNARIRVAVSEPIDATSLSVQLTPAVAGTIALDFDQLAFTFTPSANLAVSTVYTLTIGPLRDSSGNTMPAAVSTFTTSASATPDTISPTVLSFNPTSGSTNVSVTQPIVMTVSEPVRTTALEGAMRVFATIPPYGLIQLAGSYTVNPAGTVITFTPLVPYPGGTVITAFSNYNSTTTDLAGNALQSTTTAFTTQAVGDTTPPAVVTVTPPDGATGIGPAAVVTLTFSEPLLPTTVSNDTFGLFAGAAELSTSITRSADNTTVFLSATLPFDALITVVATGEVTDTSGNALADFSSTFSTGSTIETTRPQILTQRPTGPGISAGTDITLFISKPLDPATLNGAFYVSQNGVLVEGTVTVSAAGTAIRFDPATDFMAGATIQVFVTDDARDLFGNALFNYTGSFTIAPDTTALPPTIVRSSPTFFSSGNPTNTVIDVEFSEPLAPSTVTATTVFVRDASNLPVAGTLSLRNGNRTIRFTAAAPFAINNYNYIFLTNELRDLQATQFAGGSFYFYAGTAADTTAPSIVGVAPQNGATGVGVNATLRLHFSEAINPLTTTGGTLALSSSAGPIPLSVLFNPTNTTLTIVPRIPLPASTAITLTANGLEDRAGNAVAAQTLQFTTDAEADNVRPTVISTNVASYGVTNVPINASFQLTFDEPMDVASVLDAASTLLYDYVVGNYLPGTASMSADGLTLTFVPNSPLAVNRLHGLFMSTPVDLSGNSVNTLSLLFTTTFAGDTTPPAVAAVHPVAGASNVPRNVRVEIQFSESISAVSIGNVRLLANGGTPVAVTAVLNDTNRLLTLRPNGLLTANRTYTVSVTGVRDTSNNLMAGTFTSTFTTGSRTDLVAPAITGTSPSFDDRGVGLNAVARVTFSEPIDPLSVDGTSFRLGNALGGDYLDAVVTVAPDRRSATLTPSAPLLPYSRYYFTLSNVRDAAGNSGGGVTIYFYTGGVMDANAPTVVAVSPANGAAGLPVNTRVTVVMSEAIDETSVSNGSIQLTPSVAGTVTLAADRVTLTFVPSANLAASTSYSVLIAGLRDTAVNTMSAASFGFTTGASALPDTTAPTIVNRSPANGAAGIPVTTPLSFTTNEPIVAAAVGPASAPVFAVLSGVGTFQLAGTYTVDATGTVVTFNVTGAFPANATIQWYTNHNNSVRNMAGLLLPNVLAQFTTANTPDVAGPAVQAVSPPNGSTDVGPNAVVTLTLSESVNPNTVTANTVALFAGPTRLSTSVSRSLDNRMIFLSATLPAESTITVVATSGITDLSGNPLANFTSTFTTSREFDPNRPFVVTQRPTGSGVSPTTPITLFVNKPLNPSTINGGIFVSQNGALIPGTVTVESANHAIVFLPSAPYAGSASVEVTLTSAIRDTDGHAVHSYHGTFAIVSDPATSAPALRRTSPVQFSSGNPTTTVIDLEFSEPLNPATVTTATVFVRDAANAPVAGTLSLRAGNRVIRFTPTAPFAPSNFNYVNYTSQLLDMQGASVAGSSFYFYTGAVGDSTTPAVSTIVPGAGATGIGVNSSIRVAFSEAINPISVTADTVTITAGGTPLATTVTIASGNQTLTLTPQRPLPPGALITVTVNGVDDQSGHTAAAASSSFTIGSVPDITAPVVQAVSIAYGDPSVPVNSIFEWIYNEPLDVTSVLSQQSILYDYGAGAYVQGGTLSISADLRRVTYVPPANLVAGRQYLVSLSVVADIAGNFGGSSSTLFTTSAATDTAAPLVAAASPVDGVTNVPLNARIRLAFTEALSPASLGGINVLVSGLPLPVAARTLSDGNRVVTLTPTALMAPNTVHAVSIAGVRDRAGNTMPPETVATFTTGTGVDLVPPTNTVVAVPANGATNVATSVAPTVTFSEAIDLTTVLYAATAVELEIAATSQNVPIVYSLSADRRTVMMTPVTGLAAGTQYRIRVSTGVTDQAGNAFPTFLQFLFTTQP